MLARSNAFQAIPCPFFSTGLCERPYCHFKHDPQIKDNVQKSRNEANVPTSSSSSSMHISASLPSFGGYMGTVDRPPTSSGYGSTYSMAQTTEPPPPPTIIQQETPAHFSGYTGYFASYNSVDYSPASSAMIPGDDDPFTYSQPSFPPNIPSVGYSPMVPTPTKKGLLGDSPMKPATLPGTPHNGPFRPTSIPSSGLAAKIEDEDTYEEDTYKPTSYEPPPRETSLPSIVDPKKKAEAINEMAKNISDIDRQIAEVKKQMHQENEPKFSSDEDEEYNPSASSSTTSAASAKPDSKLATERENSAKPVKPKHSTPSYTPTPISELEKKKKEKLVKKTKEDKVPLTIQEKVARHKAKIQAKAKAKAEAEAAAAKKMKYKSPEKKSDPPAPKQPKPLEEKDKILKKQQQKIPKNLPVERPPSLEPEPPKKKKKKEKRAKSPQKVQIEDIFGNDSEDDDSLPSPPKINEAPPDLDIPDSSSSTALKRSKPPIDDSANPAKKKKKSKKEKLEAKASNGSSEGSNGKEKSTKKKSNESGPKDLASDAPETASKEILDLVPLGKQRQAHAASHNPESLREKAKVSGPRGHLLTARETLNMRFQQMQREKEAILKRAAAAEERKDSAAKAGTSGISNPPQKPVVKKATLTNHRDNAVAATVPKGEARKAHVAKAPPKGTGSGRPKVEPELGGKIDLATRQRYLDLIVDECLQLIEIPADAYEVVLRTLRALIGRTTNSANQRMKYFPYHNDNLKQALSEEKAVYAKSKSKTGYLSAATHVIKKFRDERQKYGSSSSSGGVHPAMGVSHSKMLDGKSEGTFTVNRTARPKAESIFSTRRGLSTNQEKFFYENLSPYVLSNDQLDENGFPRPNPMSPDIPLFKKPDMKLTIVEDCEMKRVCCRCGKSYRLLDTGEYAFPEDCIYHPGKAWKRRGPSGVEQRFNCCQADLKNPGCQLAEHHVSGDVRKSDSGGYVQTKAISHTPSGEEEPRNHKIYALDCEMVYTVYGVALARVTVVEASCNVVFEALVQPKYKVVDYNSRFSGLRAEDFEKAEQSPLSQEEVQERLLEMFSAETILIGHSLESDLRALKIIHSKVVDTSVVFPHKMGPPYKRALKTLVAEHLKKIIQEDISGHDSKEDAAGCMELMLFKVQEDLKVK